MKYYLFKNEGSKELDQFQVIIGKSLINEHISLSGVAFDLKVVDNRLYMFQDGIAVARTGKIVNEDTIQKGTVSNGRCTSFGTVVPAEILAYKTSSGSTYIFVAENTELNCL